MPGSGKSTIGKHIAAELNLAFVDLDHEIEIEAGKTIAEIFSIEGEASFRLRESEKLKTWASADESFVMATGGGAPCYHRGIEIINGSGVSIFLDVSLQVLLKRVEKRNHRPLLQGEEAELSAKLEKLREARLPVYEKATAIVRDPTPATVLEIISRLKK
jgi:shikimate kinase